MQISGHLFWTSGYVFLSISHHEHIFTTVCQVKNRHLETPAFVLLFSFPLCLAVFEHKNTSRVNSWLLILCSH